MAHTSLFGHPCPRKVRNMPGKKEGLKHNGVRGPKKYSNKFEGIGQSKSTLWPWWGLGLDSAMVRGAIVIITESA